MFLAIPTTLHADFWSRNVAPIGKAIEKGAHDAGKAIEKGTQDTGKAIEKGAHDTGNAIEKGAQDTGKGLDHFGTEFEKAFCDFFTAGRASQGEAGCNVNGGVGYDSDRGTYTYDPANPEQKYYGDETAKSSSEADKNLKEFAKYLNDSQIKTWEYEDNDVYGISRFLPPDTVLGEAWPNAAKEVSAPTSSGKIRPCCQGGGGGFLSPRNDHGKVRFHAGTDYETAAGEPIVSPVTGWVERIKNPGRKGLSGLLILNDKGYSASVYYIDPTPEINLRLALTKNFRFKLGRRLLEPPSSSSLRTPRMYRNMCM